MSVPADDRGLTLGDGLFETVLADAGELVALEAHLDRLDAGCAVLGLPAPDRSRIRRAAAEELGAADLGSQRAAVRITWTAGSGGRGLLRPSELQPRLLVTAAPAPKPEGPARLITAGVRRNEQSPASRLKTLSYLDNILARREAQAAGADEALMLNGAGDIACATVANILWFAKGRLFTPPPESGVLAGIARGEILRSAREAGIVVVEATAPPSALFEADAVFLSNSLIGLRAVAALDGRPLNQQVAQSTVWLLRGRR